MKKIFTFLVAGLLALSAQAQEGKTYQVKTLTFEDNDYPQDAPNYLGATTWSSLIDNPQYGGELLYGENHGDTSKVSTTVNYKWYDKGNTELYSEIPENWGTKMYWGGGHAISNYWEGNLKDGDYEHQLAVYVADDNGNGQGGHGHNGSNNFCVHYGYKDDSGYSASNLPAIQFKDGENHVIEGMYINNTTYFVNCITNGNGLTTALGDKDYVNVVATGYKADGTIVGSRTYPLALGTKSFVKTWTYWSLLNLGEVNKVEFNIVGSSDNGYGFSQPAYFCYDDVKVQMPIGTTASTFMSNKIERSAEKASSKTFKAYNADRVYGTNLVGDYPEGASVVFDGDNKLTAGETEKYTIKGLPDNIIIKNIRAYVSLGEIMNSDIEIDTYLGEDHIANLALVGFLSDVNVPDSSWPTQSEDWYDMNMLEESKQAGCGDLVFNLKSIGGVSEGEAQGLCYEITYELGSATSITDVNATSNVVEVARFTADGKRISAPQKGINIVRMSDGTTRKVVVK